jgi:hypothetical protein
MGFHGGFHGGRHRRFAPTKQALARLRLRHDDDGADAGDAPRSTDTTAVGVAAGSPAQPRDSRSRGLGALIRDGLSRLLAVNF